MRHNVAGSIVRLKVALPAELEVRLRDGELRTALSSAHYVAAITREVEQDRRTRIPPGVAEGLTPLDALRLYLEGKDVDPERKEVLLRYAEELVSAEPSGEDSA